MLTVPVLVPPRFTYSSKKSALTARLHSYQLTAHSSVDILHSQARKDTLLGCLIDEPFAVLWRGERRMRQWKMAITRSVRGCAMWTGQDGIALANPRNTVLRLTPDMTAVTQGQRQRWTQCGWRVMQFTGWVVTAKHWMTGSVQAQCPVSSDAVQNSELWAPVAQWLTVNHDNCRHCFCFCWCVP